MAMRKPRFILVIWIAAILNIALVFSQSVKVLGPYCDDTNNEKGKRLNCGTSVQANTKGGSISLENLCSDGVRLQIGIWRDDITIQGDLALLKLYFMLYNCFR